MISQTRKILLSAAGAAALALAAQPVLAQDRACLDDGCAIQALFEAADAPAGATSSLASPSSGTSPQPVPSSSASRPAKPASPRSRTAETLGFSWRTSTAGSS